MTVQSADESLSPQVPKDGIDPRGPRFGAAITATLLLFVILLAMPGASRPPVEPWERATQPAFLLLTGIVVLFSWGAAAGVARHPYGVLFGRVIRPRLAPPAEREDPRPPRFAQLIGLIVTGLGLVLALAGVPFALVTGAALAFVAAFLNSVFGLCIGCQLYLLLVRSRVLT
ncbi:DUF4395 domain-containing protein [Agreia bicolorata]|uniref:DUF4395 domain-containing protein n=1 Tax=Agreia bicolorata TaxID=110935 RepID=UPI0005CAD33F|nr:DUF4395 domain-containing protein [Agreia bicolorata]